MAYFLITFFLALMIIAMWFALGDRFVPLVTPLYDTFLTLNPVYMIIAVVFILIILITCLYVIIRVALKQRKDKPDPC